MNRFNEFQRSKLTVISVVENNLEACCVVATEFRRIPNSKAIEKS